MGIREGTEVGHGMPDLEGSRLIFRQLPGRMDTAIEATKGGMYRQPGAFFDRRGAHVQSRIDGAVCAGAGGDEHDGDDSTHHGEPRHSLRLSLFIWRRGWGRSELASREGGAG